jgi:sugar lactone lactonase YvrE
MSTPSMPTGLVPTDDERVIVVLEDGLHVADPDRGD